MYVSVPRCWGNHAMGMKLNLRALPTACPDQTKCARHLRVLLGSYSDDVQSLVELL